ncbi:MAG: efflux RND transporter periplasmic adaptor subunit [Planctomycetaceae bacterium]|nr:efflux RND transporter periplasmic adaptor subunit [Planctomycetaceae bacterium]
MRKVIVVCILAAIVGVVAWKYFTTEVADNSRSRRGPGIVAVETARIEQTDLGDRVVFTGTIKAEERFDAAPKIAGIIRSINYNAGDVVRRGAVLAVLDDDEYILAVEKEEASLLVAQATAQDAEAQLEIARRDYDRSKNLRDERVISEQEFDKIDATFKAAQAKYDTAVAQVRLAEAALNTAKVVLNYTRVRADWEDGPDERVIGQRWYDAGAMVAANTPIIPVLDINTVRAVISVSEKQYPRLRLNDRVTVTTDAFPGRGFPGRISRIPQELGDLTREAEVEVAVDNPDLALKPGMFVRATIEFERADNAVAAPLAAVVRRDDGLRGVYVVNDDQDAVTFQPVTEGIVDGAYVELVNADALLGREVVVLGQHLLKDGINVRVAGAAPRESAPAGSGGSGIADTAGGA